jgi:hypothetical protein
MAIARIRAELLIAPAAIPKGSAIIKVMNCARDRIEVVRGESKRKALI